MSITTRSDLPVPPVESGASVAGCIPPDIRALLNSAQAERLESLIARPSGDHAIAYQVSTAVLGRRYYFALLTGCEKRSPQRITHDGHARSFGGLLFRAALIFWAVSGLLTAILITVIVALYLIKSLLGIDLFPGQHSFLHQFFFTD